MWRIRGLFQMISFMVFFSTLLALVFLWAGVQFNIVLVIVISFCVFVASVWD